MFLEDGDNRRRAGGQSGGDELSGQCARTLAGRAIDQDGVPGWHTAAWHFVDGGYPGRQTFVGRLAVEIRSAPDDSRGTCGPARVMRIVCRPGNGTCPRIFMARIYAHTRIAIDARDPAGRAR